MAWLVLSQDEATAMQGEPQPRRSSGYILGSFRKLSLTQTPPRWGDFSESANVCGHGTPQSRPATAPDRSEIGPYLV